MRRYLLVMLALLAFPAEAGKVVMSGYGAGGCSFAAAPTINVGAIASAVASTVSVSFDTTASANDLLFTVTESDVGVNPTCPSGYSEISSSPQEVGTAAGDGTHLQVCMKVAAGGETAETVGVGSIDHVIARALRVTASTRCVGTNIDVQSGTTNGTASTTFSAPSVTTTHANELVIVIVTGGIDGTNTTTEYTDVGGGGGWTNANLSSLTEIADNRRTVGNGGQLGIVKGTKATAGSTGATTGTSADSAKMAMITLAIPGA